MKSKHESTDVKSWYSRGYLAMKNFARNHPFLTVVLIAGIIIAAVFTLGTILLVPPAMFGTMAFVSNVIAFSPPIFAAAAVVGVGALRQLTSSTVIPSLEEKNKVGAAASLQTPDVADLSVNVNSSHGVVSRTLELERVSSNTSDRSCDERQSVNLSADDVNKEGTSNEAVLESKSACPSMG